MSRMRCLLVLFLALPVFEARSLLQAQQASAVPLTSLAPRFFLVLRTRILTFSSKATSPIKTMTRSF